MSETPLKILVVDDEAPARRRLRELLDDCAGALPLVVVGEAGSGREALGLLGSTPADLVLSDIHMPDMDGIELARHLLKLPLPPVLIFTTAYHEHAIAAFEVHAIDYLMKPVRVQRLLSALQKVPRLRPLSGARLDRLPAAARRFLSVTARSRVVLVPVEDDTIACPSWPMTSFVARLRLLSPVAARPRHRRPRRRPRLFQSSPIPGATPWRRTLSPVSADQEAATLPPRRRAA